MIAAAALRSEFLIGLIGWIFSCVPAGEGVKRPYLIS